MFDLALLGLEQHLIMCIVEPSIDVGTLVVLGQQNVVSHCFKANNKVLTYINVSKHLSIT